MPLETAYFMDKTFRIVSDPQGITRIHYVTWTVYNYNKYGYIVAIYNINNLFCLHACIVYNVLCYCAVIIIIKIECRVNN